MESDDDEMDLSNFHTPQTLAWKLLMEDNISDLSSTILSFNMDGYDEENDPISFTFEILLTIFVEMISSLLTLMSEDNENVRKQLVISDFFDTIKSKFTKASISIFIHEIEKEWLETDDGYFKNILDKRYCKVIMRDNPEESQLFNAYNVDNDMLYHMLLNAKYKQQSNLKDVCANISSGKNIYQISFDFFNRQTLDVPKMI